jgi:hypothetical protein
VDLDTVGDFIDLLLNLGRGAPILTPADLLETVQPASASS